MQKDQEERFKEPMRKLYIIVFVVITVLLLAQVLYCILQQQWLGAIVILIAGVITFGKPWWIIYNFYRQRWLDTKPHWVSK